MIRPVRDRILVRVQYKDETEGGIQLPAGHQDPLDMVRGRVLAIGDWVNQPQDGRPSMGIVVNDIIIFGPYAGQPVRLNDRDKQGAVKLVAASDVLGVETEGEQL